MMYYGYELILCKCPHCGKEYLLETWEQTPGFRDSVEEICPYCEKVIRKSMEYEFFTYKTEEFIKNNK